MKNLIIAALVAVIATGGSISLYAATRTVETTADVEVRVWQSVSDGSLYLSTRPEDGSWTTHRNSLDMSELSPSGNFRQSSFVTVVVPLSVTVEVPDPPPVGTTESTQEPFGEWEYFEVENIDGNHAGYSLTGYSDGGLRLEATLVWRCNLDAGLGSIFISQKTYIPGDSDGIVTVQYRSSGGDLMEEMWVSDEDPFSTVWIIADTTNFHRELRGSTGQLFVLVIDSEDDAKHFTFDVAGAGDVADWYRNSCPNSVFSAP